ncbi:ABC transporter permease [Syntrophomonas wolfei]|uniref:ABC-type multidrug transport system permease component n=1 Tax=Syntrophomonas wolfei subsp. wolfei (strain DSM 2245B / Goettingen) TaxID=335541 RepID=Q0B0H1_SYNWW|nr:ABC transporter permease [Syntrophomonas wolfei]ABI67533.1 ABC-type multidrug transport system permease component [Syntrophomonas wolfei subsp. wolfei str. Goettingen G311]
MRSKSGFKIMRREFNYMWRDRGLRKILLLGPILGLFLFMAIYQTQTVKDIPTAIVDLDGSSSSREISEKIKHAEHLKLRAYPQSYEDLEQSIRRGEIVVGVVIPENFGRDVARHHPTRVLVIVDSSNTVYATNASTAVLGVIRSISAEAGVKTLLARGMDPSQARKAFLTVDYREEGWFNPTLNYAYFLVLAMALNIWQQCCTMTASMNVIGETGMKSWLQVKASGVSRFKYFFSKSLAHLITFMLLVIPVYILALGIFKLPLSCGLGMLLLFTLVFAVSLHSVGTLMSSLANNAVDSTRFGMMVALPSFVLCGYTWPIEAMPGFLQSLVWILPQTWFFQGFNYLSFKDPGWSFMLPYFGGLLVISLVCYSMAAMATAWMER